MLSENWDDYAEGWESNLDVITYNETLDGAERSTMDALALETEHADKGIVF